MADPQMKTKDGQTLCSSNAEQIEQAAFLKIAFVFNSVWFASGVFGHD